MSTPDDTNTGASTEEDQGRLHPRRDFQSEIELSLESDHNFYTGFTENISSGGLFIATRDLKAIGTTMEISFTLPGHATKITTRAEVRWQRLEQPHTDSMPGIGVRFLDLEAGAAASINAFLVQRDSLFYDED
ncbi:MAG: TIGR02266 family protein [Myxococcota bacterium]|nr:TIGR02266 family protein [Myxococcota bacterium]